MTASVLPDTRTTALERSKQPSLPITANKTQPYFAKSKPMLRKLGLEHFANIWSLEVPP